MPRRDASHEPVPIDLTWARPHERAAMDDAVAEARTAFADLLTACPPWAEHRGTTGAFTELHDLLDGGVAFGLLGPGVQPASMLRSLAMSGSRAVPLTDRSTPAATAMAHLPHFLAGYARPAADTERLHLLGTMAATDLAPLPKVIAAALGPTVPVREPNQPPISNDVRWLEPRPPAARLERPDETMQALTALGAHSDLDPLVIAALAHARILLTRPFRRRNEAAALLTTDHLVRATPGISAARINLARTFLAQQDALRSSLRAAARDHDWAAWIVTFARTIAQAALDATDRARAYSAAATAVQARLSSPEGRAILGRRRVSTRALATLAARRPYLGIHRIVAAGLAQPRTAGRYLSSLVRLGVGTDVRWGRVRLLRVSTLADALTRPLRDTSGAAPNLAPAALLAAVHRAPFVGADDP